MDSHLVHYQAEERQFVQNLEHGVLRARDRHAPYLTDFFDPRQLQLAQIVAGRSKELTFHYYGGYAKAERCRGLFLPDYLTPVDEDWEMTVLRMEPHDPLQTLQHGDYLGALTGLGVKRSKYGDISVRDTYADLILTRELCTYVELHLTHVGRTRVHTSEVSFAEFSVPEVRMEERTFTVASPRLDAVLSDAVKLSRAKILEPIRGSKVQVNFRSIENPAYEVAVGDVISLRGFGRIKILEMNGLSKKGRLFVKIGKYL